MNLIRFDKKKSFKSYFNKNAEFYFKAKLFVLSILRLLKNLKIMWLLI